MPIKVPREGKTYVALHPEGVDRNVIYDKLQQFRDVALHPEGVDRNRVHV